MFGGLCSCSASVPPPPLLLATPQSRLASNSSNPYRSCAQAQAVTHRCSRCVRRQRHLVWGACAQRGPAAAVLRSSCSALVLESRRLTCDSSAHRGNVSHFAALFACCNHCHCIAIRSSLVQRRYISTWHVPCAPVQASRQDRKSRSAAPAPATNGQDGCSWKAADRRASALQQSSASGHGSVAQWLRCVAAALCISGCAWVCWRQSGGWRRDTRHLLKIFTAINWGTVSV
jgi:hypothetical protein